MERGGAGFFSAGSVNRQKDGSLRAEFTLRYGRVPATPSEARTQAVRAPDLLHPGRVHRAADGVGMKLMAAGAERLDKNRRLGSATIYRDFRFEAAPRDRIVRLLRALAQGPGVITQIRYKLVEDPAGVATATRRWAGRLMVRIAAVRPLDADEAD